MYDIPKVRDALVEYFQSKADYRQNLAEDQEPWEGSKNEGYAASLRLVADYVRALPDDDATLRMLASREDLFIPDGTVFQPPAEPEGLSATDNQAVHCGPRGESMNPPECAEWFEAWAQSAVDEANEIAANQEETEGL